MGPLARGGLLIAMLTLCGCGATARWSEPTPPPMEFSVPDWLIEFDSQLPPARIKRHMARSGCGEADADMSSLAMMAGLMTRPDSGGLVVQKGTLANGADWFALKDARYSAEAEALCGLSIGESPQGSAVALFGVRRQHRAAAIEAVERGTFLCECEVLSGP